jgi:hypothetical protein
MFAGKMADVSVFWLCKSLGVFTVMLLLLLRNI